jgi:acyl-CoA thioesterase
LDTETVTFARQLELKMDEWQPGRYAVDVDPAWNCPAIPHGGIMASIASRAMTLELARVAADDGRGGADSMALRTQTTVFAAPVPAGPVTIDVAVLRSGRTMSQARAEVRAAGADAGHTTVAVFGRPRRGFELVDLEMPEVPPPGDCPSFRDEPPEGVDWDPNAFPFWLHVEGRPALGHAPWDRWVPTTSETASWMRFDDPPTRPDGTLDPLALVTFADTMPSAVGELLGPDDMDWYAPSADLTVHVLAEPRSEWILAHKRLRRATGGYCSAEVALWDPDPAVGLVAHATQVMFFTTPQL